MQIELLVFNGINTELLCGKDTCTRMINHRHHQEDFPASLQLQLVQRYMR